jgi:hypothetical protein
MASTVSGEQLLTHLSRMGALGPAGVAPNLTGLNPSTASSAGGDGGSSPMPVLAEA